MAYRRRGDVQKCHRVLASTSLWAAARPATISQKTHSITGAVYGPPTTQPSITTVDSGEAVAALSAGPLAWSRRSGRYLPLTAPSGQLAVPAFAEHAAEQGPTAPRPVG
jgi:hypothetical protein